MSGWVGEGRDISSSLVAPAAFDLGWEFLGARRVWSLPITADKRLEDAIPRVG